MKIHKFLQILQNFDEILKIRAKVCKIPQILNHLAGESCTIWKTLQNAPTLAIVAVHTAENEPPKVLKKIRKIIFKNA